MPWWEVIGLVGSVCGIAGLVYGVMQGRENRKLHRQDRVRYWGLARMAVGLAHKATSLNTLVQEGQTDGPKLVGLCGSMKQGIDDFTRQVIENAVLNEKCLDRAHIEHWKAIGLIESNYSENIVKQFLLDPPAKAGRQAATDDETDPTTA